MEEGKDRGICKAMVWLLRVVVIARSLRSEDKKVQHRDVRNMADVFMAGLPDGKPFRPPVPDLFVFPG
jgi:hypothetical protein